MCGRRLRGRFELPIKADVTSRCKLNGSAFIQSIDFSLQKFAATAGSWRSEVGWQIVLSLQIFCCWRYEEKKFELMLVNGDCFGFRYLRRNTCFGSLSCRVRGQWVVSINVTFLEFECVAWGWWHRLVVELCLAANYCCCGEFDRRAMSWCGKVTGCTLLSAIKFIFVWR